MLVAAPTGSGKTVVAEHAVALALASGRKCFYTAPIKALSNQKFSDLRRELGDEQVGLLTGDHSINAGAPVVVMTTEVLRNMVYAGSAALDGLGWVVLDEVHFLQDAYRGPVWEEVLVHTPRCIGFVCLSATVSNAEELGDWIEALRGPTDTVIEHRRPIRLDPVMLVGDRSAEREHLVPLLVHGRPNPEGHRFDVDRPMQRGGPRGRPRSRFFTPRRIETVERLDEEGLLPAIYFIFSRNGCNEAARSAMTAGLRLTDAAERTRIRQLAEHRTRALSDEDHLRAYVIRELMCNLVVHKGEVRRRFGVDFDAHFAELDGALGKLADDGLIHEDGEALRVEALGQLFVRSVAMLFDAYTQQRRQDRPTFSRTV